MFGALLFDIVDTTDCHRLRRGKPYAPNQFCRSRRLSLQLTQYCIRIMPVQRKSCHEVVADTKDRVGCSGTLHPSDWLVSPLGHWASIKARTTDVVTFT